MNKKRIRPDYLLTVLIAGGVISLLVWATIGEIARNPSRQVMVEMGSYGLVTVQLVTDPYPALSAEPVTLEFMLMNARGQSIRPDVLLSNTVAKEAINLPVRGRSNR